MARTHSVSLIGQLRFAENGVFAVTKCIQDQGESVFGGSLQLQIMELRKRSLRFDAIAKAARRRKDAPCVAACVGLAV